MRYDQKFILIFIYSTRFSCHNLMKLNFSRHMFRKYTNSEFYESVQWELNSSMLVDRRKDRRTEGEMKIRKAKQADMTQPIALLSNFVNAPKNVHQSRHYFRSLRSPISLVSYNTRT